MAFISSMDFVGDIELARAYLKARARDAVAAYNTPGLTFAGPIDLAQYLARYW